MRSLPAGHRGEWCNYSRWYGWLPIRERLRHSYRCCTGCYRKPVRGLQLGRAFQLGLKSARGHYSTTPNTIREHCNTQPGQHRRLHDTLPGRRIRLLKSNNSTSAAKLLIIFLTIFSLASLEGPLSTQLLFPSIHPRFSLPYPDVRLGPCPVTIITSCGEYWVPAGPSEDTLVATIFTDEQAEFTNIQSASPTIDFTDWPLTPDLIGPFTSSNNFFITSTISQAGYFEIQFMLANNFWGCDFSYGNSACGVQIRQGIAHVIDAAKFAANEPSLAGQAVALDTPVPLNNIGGLPTANPCAWDTMFLQTGSNCIVGAPGGTAYHLGSAAGANGISWLQAPGSADLNAAAQHFVNAGIATGFNATTSALTGISSAALAHNVNFFIRNDNTPRLHLGESIAAQICYLFTRTYTTPCPYLSIGVGGGIGDFPGFTTSKTNVNLSWGMYTAAYSSPTGPSPFDSSLYFRYNSRFVSGIPSIQPPNGPCASTAVPTVSAPDYMYLCNTNYDNLSNKMEFAPYLTLPGCDPVVGSANNNATLTCPTSQLSAIGAGVQAEDQFGKTAYTLPIFEQNAQFGFLNNGWIRVSTNVLAGLPNYFAWLNAWNPNPVQPGTIRQGFKQTTSSANPFVDSSLWDERIVGSVYDSLTLPAPSPGQQIEWMVLNVGQLSIPSLTYTPPTGTQQTLRFTLRNDLFFQDGRKVTSFDVAFSYLALKSTGAFIGASAAPITGVTVLGPTVFDLNVNTAGPFTSLTLSSLPILPAAYWTSGGSSAWSGGISGCTATGASCYPAQYTLSTPSGPVSCALSCASFPASLMNVNLPQTSAGYDPIANHSLVGSGPWQCGTVTNSGSGVCTSTGAENPPVGGSYTLTRFGKGLAPASTVSNIYFRSSGNLALWIWSQDNGDITHDFLNYSVVASCFGRPVTPTGPCTHFQQGIGANGGPIPVGLSQVSIVNRFVGLNWVAPFNWVTAPPVGITPLQPILYENTVTLNPASVAGCASSYPAGGYDC